LLDSHITDDLAEPSWYVMPVAKTIREALGSDPEPEMVVAAVADFATTLEALAAEGVAHRDIKPDNLFELDGNWVIGDFGLVAYPEKNPCTEHGRRLGPTDYMAPEMRQDADQADPGPADVWALAKTLWVLLTGQPLPLPGTHRPAELAHSLQERITFRFAGELDLLLEKATQIEPERRVSMADKARELRACTVPPPEDQPSASLDELHARVAALTATSRQHLSDFQARQVQISNAWIDLERIVAEKAYELSELLTFYTHSEQNGYQATELLGRPPFTPHHGSGIGHLLFPRGQQRPVVQVTVEAAMTVLRKDDPADIAAVLQVDRIIGNQGLHEVHKIWAKTYLGVPIASAQQATVLADIRAGFTAAFPSALRQVIQILSASPLRNG
jgi:serine/threonine protein kinase